MPPKARPTTKRPAASGPARIPSYVLGAIAAVAVAALAYVYVGRVDVLAPQVRGWAEPLLQPLIFFCAVDRAQCHVRAPVLGSGAHVCVGVCAGRAGRAHSACARGVAPRHDRQGLGLGRRERRRVHHRFGLVVIRVTTSWVTWSARHAFGRCVAWKRVCRHAQVRWCFFMVSPHSSLPPQRSGSPQRNAVYRRGLCCIQRC